ncbi:hypothetical protein FOA43_002826 [Brettanomyces nanus]|uniref:Uncharacterized protein n=1 Tax=Eeniella nana TaxID=13502 RepID=A0A875S153_EENNA|nr:uncharacterized protein FOA43_002826 [Brettanomyces nanus]QPG75471.1 hypothetical protein FOA43_002826 [Brettanomyces nanus]
MANQDLQSQYSNYQQIIGTLNDKLSQLDSDLGEHKVVLDSLNKLPEDRRCWRMVDSSLIELQCKEARGVLKNRIEGMEKSIKNLSEETHKKQEEFVDWKQKNNVRIVKAN